VALFATLGGSALRSLLEATRYDLRTSVTDLFKDIGNTLM
jgi:hypothetical protein